VSVYVPVACTNLQTSNSGIWKKKRIGIGKGREREKGGKGGGQWEYALTA